MVSTTTKIQIFLWGKHSSLVVWCQLFYNNNNCFISITVFSCTFWKKANDCMEWVRSDQCAYWWTAVALYTAMERRKSKSLIWVLCQSWWTCFDMFTARLWYADFNANVLVVFCARFRYTNFQLGIYHHHCTHVCVVSADTSFCVCLFCNRTTTQMWLITQKQRHCLGSFLCATAWAVLWWTPRAGRVSSWSRTQRYYTYCVFIYHVK